MPASRKPAAKTPAKRSTRLSLPDQAAMQAFVATIGTRRATSAANKAQQVIYDAWETSDRPSQRERAHRALRLSPLCADAYNLLARQASTPERALALHQRGLEAGELMLGAEGFAAYDGRFWGHHETRPYMRARAGVALALIKLGRVDEAVTHLRAMLRLNPNDNQGMRYVLLGCLIALDDRPAARTLISAYADDGGIWWLYGQALLEFRDGRHGSAETKALVQNALTANPYVAGIMAGKAAAVFSPGSLAAVGSPAEATEYLRHCRQAWRETPGAVEWLIEAAGQMQA